MPVGHVTALTLMCGGLHPLASYALQECSLHRFNLSAHIGKHKKQHLHWHAKSFNPDSTEECIQPAGQAT